MISSEACASFFIFLLLDFHELWQSMTSTCLITDVKQQWATLVLEWVIVSVLSQVQDVSDFFFDRLS